MSNHFFYILYSYVYIEALIFYPEEHHSGITRNEHVKLSVYQLQII